MPNYANAEKRSKVIAQAYDVVDQLTPLVLANQGSSRMVGIKTPRTFDGTEDLSAQRFTFGQYTFDVRFKQPPRSPPERKKKRSFQVHMAASSFNSATMSSSWPEPG